jgi:hypothetical protein
MQWTGKGKVTVATSGTIVPLAPANGPAVKINTLMVTFDTSDGAATVYVKDQAGNILSSMSSGNTQPVVFTAPGSNQLDLRNFSIDASANGKGPFVAYGVD